MGRRRGRSSGARLGSVKAPRCCRAWVCLSSRGLVRERSFHSCGVSAGGTPNLPGAVVLCRVLQVIPLGRGLGRMSSRGAFLLSPSLIP